MVTWPLEKVMRPLNNRALYTNPILFVSALRFVLRPSSRWFCRCMSGQKLWRYSKAWSQGLDRYETPTLQTKLFVAGKLDEVLLKEFGEGVGVYSLALSCQQNVDQSDGTPWAKSIIDVSSVSPSSFAPAFGV